MKILVIDDNPIHRQSALQTLGNEHELTVVGTHNEAMEALSSYIEGNKCLCEDLKTILQEQGLPTGYRAAQDFYNGDRAGYLAWLDISKTIGKTVYWDAVLCDLLMPVEEGEVGMSEKGQKYIGQEMAVGWALALQAALASAKFVAVASDMDHHDHPASAMLDSIEQVMSINNARVLFTNHVKTVVIDELPAITCPSCLGFGRDPKSPKRGCYLCKGVGMYQQEGKDWADVLMRLQEDQ
ncbi:MAG: hypothetical protein WCK16_02835 [Candidatus Moraniibacteriota bacterium]